MARAPLNTDKRFSDAKKRPVSVEYFLLRSLTHVVLTWNSDDGRKARVASTASQQRSASLWLLNDCCRRATTVTVREQNTTTTTSFHKTRDKLHYHTMQVNDIGIWNFQNNSNFIDEEYFFSITLLDRFREKMSRKVERKFGQRCSVFFMHFRWNLHKVHEILFWEIEKDNEMTSCHLETDETFTKHSKHPLLSHSGIFPAGFPWSFYCATNIRCGAGLVHHG